MTTFYRNGDKHDAWEFLTLYSDADAHWVHFMQGQYLSLTVCIEGDETVGANAEFNWALNWDGRDECEVREIDLNNPRYSMFEEWARQIIKEEQETDQ